MATPAERSAAARLAANVSWARTPIRAERTAQAHAASPTSYTYWLNKIQQEGEIAPQDQAAAAKNAHRVYMTQLSRRAAASRRSRKAARLAEREGNRER
ncbi:hypothetical protein [Actinomadura gamaensis]|uniref:Uncharacterized protein n=1 Tax=Actinomadura gamaensis TaxID=1763541 RepID=A0ABV9U8P7_9ACTN